MTTFLLDPRVLDDCVSDSAKDIVIPAEAFAYFLQGENSRPGYTFYLKGNHTNFVPSRDSASLSLRTLDVFKQEYDGHHGDLSLRFQKANLVFMPVSDGDRYQWGSRLKEFRESYLEACGVLYIRGEFLKGDAEELKQYGIKIL